MGKELNLEFISTDAFVGFLNKFISIDSNALLEIRTDNTLVIKSYTASRTAVKMGVIALDEIFEVDDNEIKDNIKVGIYNLEKLIKFFSFVEANDGIMFKVEYKLDSDGDNYAKRIWCNTKVDKKDFACANKTLFKYMSDDTAEGVFGVKDNLFNLKIDQSILTKISNYSSLEPASELSFCAYTKNGEQIVDFKGKSYSIGYYGDFEINKEVEKAAISKDYLKFCDKEEYKVYITGPSIIFISETSNTKLALGRLPDDGDEYEEENDTATAGEIGEIMEEIDTI